MLLSCEKKKKKVLLHICTRILNECTSLQSTTDYFENENNSISWQKIYRFLLTISKDAYEEIGLGTFQLWQLPLNIEQYNAVFFLIHSFIFTNLSTSPWSRQ